MCFSSPKPQVIQTTPAPTKTSAETQTDAETDRTKVSGSSRGIAGTILTAGLGDTSTPTTKGVTLGGF